MSSRGGRSSSRFARRIAGGEPLDAILEDPEAFAQAAALDDPAMFRAWEAAAETAAPPAGQFDPSILALAVFEETGQPAFMDSRFAAQLSAVQLHDGDLAAALSTGEVLRAMAEAGEQTVALALAAPAAALHWPLPPDAREALNAAPRRVAVMAVARAAQPLKMAAAAFRLTPMEARVVTALAEGGKLPAAARRAGVGYEAAREALGRAMKKVGVRRQPELISRLTTFGLGLWRSRAAPEQVLQDVYDLSPRQSRVAVLVAEGAERAEAARKVGAAEAVIKDELSVVFQVLDVTSAAELSRRVTEALAFAVLSAPSGAALIPHSDREEPLRLIPRPDGSGWIAVSDYGPENGQPVFILHTTATCRHVARSFVAALRRAGYRPLALDRPSFGLTSPAEGEVFSAAARDMLTVCEALRLDKVRIIGRAALQVAWHFQAMAPERLERIVAFNPNLACIRAIRTGFLGGLARFVGNRITTLALARVFAAGVQNTARVERLLHQAVRSCPADAKVFESQSEVDDYVRSCRYLASGSLEGLVGEHVAIADANPLPGPIDTSRWRLIVAEQDPLFDVEAVVAGSLAMLPDAAVIRLSDAGRFPHLSHPAKVIAALGD